MTIISSSTGVTARTFDEKATLAKSPSTSPLVLSALCLEDSPTILRYVAQNPSTPQEGLLFLAKKKDYSVRHDALYNPSLTASNLILLLTESEASDRVAIANNAALPIASRVTLALSDEDHLVRRAAWLWIQDHADLAWEDAINCGISLTSEIELGGNVYVPSRYLEDNNVHSLLETLISIELGKKVRVAIADTTLNTMKKAKPL